MSSSIIRTVSCDVIFLITSRKQMNNNSAPCLNILFYTSYAELPQGNMKQRLHYLQYFPSKRHVTTNVLCPYGSLFMRPLNEYH